LSALPLTSVLALAAPASAAGAEGGALLANLAVILCVAAITTVLFQRIHQPVILGYLLAGVIVGPHLPFPLVADESLAHTYSELGVILLMFAMGLEFSLRKLARVAASAGLIAFIECSFMLWLGYVVGLALGWTRQESFFAGAMVAISSTTIIVKAFEERGIKGLITEVVFGILVVEDLVAILLLAVLTAIASGAGVSAGHLAHIAARLGGLLALQIVGGLLIVPRLVRMVVRVGRPETIVVASVGICSRSRTRRASAAIPSRSARSTPARASASPASDGRSSRSSRPCATCSRPSSSSPWACRSIRASS